jgi:ribosomal protein S13
MTDYYHGINGARYLDDSLTDLSGSDNQNITGFSGDDLVIAIRIFEAVSGKNPTSQAFSLEWRNISDTGSWTALGNTGELTYNATVPGITNGGTWTTGEWKCSDAGRTTDVQTTVSERIGSNADLTIDLGPDNETEIAWAVDFSGADKANGDQYEFRLVDSGTTEVMAITGYVETSQGATTYTRTLSLDAYLKELDLTKTTQLDALLKAIDQTKTTSLDALLALVQTISIQLDAYLRKEYTVQTDLDAYLTEVDLTTQTELDALLNKLGLTESLELDAILYKGGSIATDLDALLKILDQTEITDLDAYLKKLYSIATDLDAYLRKEQTTTTELDAILYALGTVQITTDLDALLKELDLTISTQLDAYLQETDLTETADLDAYLKKLYTVTADLDAYLKKQITITTELDAILYSGGEIKTYLDSLLKALDQISTVSLDAILITTGLEGSATWGYDTGVTEDNILDFSAYWSGTGEVKGSGDGEFLSVGVGEYMELTNPWNFGTGKCVFDITKYEAPGGSITRKYKTGTDSSDCEADTWNTYSVPFDSEGYVQLRVEG